MRAQALLREPLHASTLEGAMTDDRRNENELNRMRTDSVDQKEQQDRDDLARRRELTRQAQLTNREREERWPIG